MATETVTAGQSAPKLSDVAIAQMDQLFDVLALLSAIEDRTSEENLPHEAPKDVKERACGTMRLAQMASDKVRATIDALDQRFCGSAA